MIRKDKGMANGELFAVVLGQVDNNTVGDVLKVLKDSITSLTADQWFAACTQVYGNRIPLLHCMAAQAALEDRGFIMRRMELGKYLFIAV
jgi:hypothetical protein